MRPAAVAAVVVALLAACGGDPPDPQPVVAVTDDTVAVEVVGPRDPERPGNPAVYERIAARTDCDELQDELDTALANAELREPGDVIRTVSITYAQAADRRMTELGCR